ncbi:MAG: SDR family oxidoreductase [Bacteroidota bacterium]
MNIFVTGASRGIGFSLVKVLSRNPQNKILAMSRDVEALNAALSNLEGGAPKNVVAAAFDVRNFKENELVQLLEQHCPQVHVLINNAGLLVNKPFLDLTQEDWQAMFDTNIFGVARLIKTAVPFLSGNGEPAHIVNIGSMGGFQGSSKFPGLSAYSASKAALANLTECLAEELKSVNIHSNCLCLGAVDTEMLRTAFPGYQAPVSSDEMAEFIANFSQTAHRYLNGKVVSVSLSTP